MENGQTVGNAVKVSKKIVRKEAQIIPTNMQFSTNERAQNINVRAQFSTNERVKNINSTPRRGDTCNYVLKNTSR